MYTWLMALSKQELAEVAMVEGVLGAMQATGWAGRESAVRRREGQARVLLREPALLSFSTLHSFPSF